MRTLHFADGVLEPQTAVQTEELFALLSHPELYRHEGEPPPSREWLRARLARLESRWSPDRTEQWLNWVIRCLPGGDLAGYVQATVRADASAYVAYVLGRAHWGRGLASRAVSAMLAELSDHYRVRIDWAVCKRGNLRSQRLLSRLGFVAAAPGDFAAHGVENDEALLVRELSGAVE